MTRSSPGRADRRRPVPRPTARWRRLRSPRARRVLAALLAALTVGLTVQVLLARPLEDDVPVLVAARDVPAGATLGAGDVELRHLPPRALPSATLTDPGAVAGRSTAVPLAAGRVLVAGDLRTSALLDGLPEEAVAAYLPVAEPAVAAALSSGDRVDVHSPVDGGVVVSGALVLRAGAGEDPGLWLAVGGAEAEALAAARGADPLGAALQVTLHPAPSGQPSVDG